MRFLLLACLPLAGCTCGEEPAGPGDDAGAGADAAMPPPGTVSIAIDPSQVDLTIDGVVPVSQAFKVEAIDSQGNHTDVTQMASFDVIDDTLGTMSGATFTTKLLGGRTNLDAFLGQFKATAVIDIHLQRTVVIPDPTDPLPTNPGMLVDNAPDQMDRAPELVYPNDGVMLPVNLGSLEVHYRPGRDNTLFEIAFTSATADVKVYTRCTPLGGGCVYAPSADVWRFIAESNRGLDPLEIRVRGTDAQGTARGTSAVIKARVSAVRVDGGIYYWTTSEGGKIYRVDFGAAQPPEQYYPFMDNGVCYGCHAISKNGRRMTLSRNGQWDGRLTIIDTTAAAILLQDQDDKREQFQSWDPTSTKFAGVFADNAGGDTHIRIRDGMSGEVLENLDMGVEPDHPDWSPRGDRIIFSVVTHHQTSQRPGRAGISYIEQMSGGGWKDKVELLPPIDGLNRYYPAYAPDAAFFIYCESTCPQGQTYDSSCDADADPSAKMWVMAANGGTPIVLAKANGPGVADNGATDLSNTFPKWAPFVDPQKRDGSGRLMWFTFSSRRKYGLRSPNGSDQWLWMTAIDPDAVGRGDDGSFAAFALPFQNLETSNHIAQWTAAIVPVDPGSDGGTGADGSGDPGSDGGSCVHVGDMCDPSVSDPCCAGSTCSMNGPGIFLCRPNV